MMTERLPREFRHFAEVTREQSPLYAFLSARVAEHEAILELASFGQKRQPPSNLLFGAVHMLLLGGAAHPLAAFYPSVGGEAPCEESWPAFVDFCQQFREEILVQVRTRRVQTNEVGRAGLLMPAMALAFQSFRQSLHLIELGCSAGLNLNLDRFRYEYSNGHVVGDASPVVIRTALRGHHTDAIALPTVLPTIADRLGIDIEPVDVNDRDAMLWTEALLWPSDLGRFERFRAAVELARQHPPTLRRGDGLDLLPQAIADVHAEHVPCIVHSHAIYQMDKAWREQFHTMINSLGSQCNLAHVELEWLDDDPGPQLHLTTWRDCMRTHRHLANCNPHGRWMEPLASDVARSN
jgi:hypothetical protein